MAANRRDFLLSTLGSATLLAQPAQARPTAALPRRTLGRTGRSLPVLGHGGSAFIERFLAKYGLDKYPDVDRVAMIRHGYDRGMRYFDTARSYAESESLMGEALADVRAEVFLASKISVRKPEEVRASVEESLRQLRTDHVDAMQVHGPVIEALGYDGVMPLREELEKLRQEGMLRYIGLTGHSRFDKMFPLIDQGNFDTVLLELGYFRKGYNTRHSMATVEWRDRCVARAHALDMGIVAMKVLGASIFSWNAARLAPDFGADRLAALPAAAMRWVLADDRIHVLNIGISSPDDIDRNVEALLKNAALTEQDRVLLATFSAHCYAHPDIAGLKEV